MNHLSFDTPKFIRRLQRRIFLQTPAKVRARVRAVIKDEDGSLAPLVIGLFLITTLSATVIVNYSTILLKQRILVQHNERAIQKAAHEIDLQSYYTGGLNEFQYELSPSAMSGQLEYRVPIDCRKAYETYRQELVLSLTDSLRLESVNSELEGATSVMASSWQIDSFTCDGTTLRAKITQLTPLPFQFPILGIYTATIHSTSSALSVSM